MSEPITRLTTWIDQPDSLIRPPAEPTQEAIRARAYANFEARGRGPGDPITDWLRAERELREELQF